VFGVNATAVIWILLLATPGVAVQPAAPARPEKITAPAAGMFLVASRGLLSTSFSRSVVLITRHDARGTLGVIVNRRTRFKLQDVLPDLAGVEQADYSLSMGGPVAAQVIVMLLRGEPAGKGIERVTDEISFSAEQAVLESLLGRRKPAGEVRLFVGHAGWAAGQLNRELAHGGWHLAPGDARAVFGEDVNDLWERLIDRLDPPGIHVQSPGGTGTVRNQR
jgi:putative transcriptional regulator